MTIPEAQRFVARWRKILIPRGALTEADALRKMEGSCIGICGGMSLLVCLSLVSSKVPRVVGAVALMIGLFAFQLVLRFRSIRRLFASRSDLKE